MSGQERDGFDLTELDDYPLSWPEPYETGEGGSWRHLFGSRPYAGEFGPKFDSQKGN